MSVRVQSFELLYDFSLAELLICEQNEMVENVDKEDAEEKKEDIQASQKERRTKIISGVLKSMALLILVSKMIYHTYQCS